MDKYLSSKDIYEQFADAATALVMDQYAAALQESIVATRNDKNTNVPENMDRRCRKAIKRVIAKQQRKLMAKKLLRFTGAAAMITLMLFGIAGVLFTTVEAVRTPIINFYIEQNERYMEISGTDLNKNQYADSESVADDPLYGLLPEGYEKVLHEVSEGGALTIAYENAKKQYIRLFIIAYSSTLHVDTEDAIDTQKTKVASHEAVLVEKNGLRLVWLNTEIDVLYQLSSNGLNHEEISKLAENIEIFN